MYGYSITDIFQYPSFLFKRYYAPPREFLIPSPPEEFSETSPTATSTLNLTTPQESTVRRKSAGYGSTIISLPSSPITPEFPNTTVVEINSAKDSNTSLMYDAEERVSNINAYDQVDSHPHSSDQTNLPISPLSSLSHFASLDTGNHNSRQWPAVVVNPRLDRELTPNVVMFVRDDDSEDMIEEGYEDLYSALSLVGNHGQNLQKLIVTVPRDYVPKFVAKRLPTLKEHKHFTELEWCGSAAAFPQPWDMKPGPFAYLQTLRLTNCTISIVHCGAILSRCELLNYLEVNSLAAPIAYVPQWESELPQPRSYEDVKTLNHLKYVKLTSSVDLSPLFSITKFPELIEMSLSLHPKLKLDPSILPWTKGRPWTLNILSRLNDSDREEFTKQAKSGNYKFTYNIPPITA
ncbi:hypothetical protein BDQ12DRAFT_264282 [Crucibulum laeve]|uniref:Uncharacterized protein n=1 Tax=Crucibulum laeve TaxID=68775 RepID=A0A5C3LS99_9AGAR|nr:hypothetical protein BDQ12DRAFT_264282 [Crucibulum laeve]